MRPGSAKAGTLAVQLSRLGVVVLDELGYRVRADRGQPLEAVDHGSDTVSPEAEHILGRVAERDVAEIDDAGDPRSRSIDQDVFADETAVDVRETLRAIKAIGRGECLDRRCALGRVTSDQRQPFGHASLRELRRRPDPRPLAGPTATHAGTPW